MESVRFAIDGKNAPGKRRASPSTMGRRKTEGERCIRLSMRALIGENRVIPAIRDPDLLDTALSSRSNMIYLLFGEPESIEFYLKKSSSMGKVALVNIDLFGGLSRDQHALTFLKNRGACGIISTHGGTLRQARSMGLYAIQRTFLLDSGALESAYNQIKDNNIDALEILPAVAAPKLINRMRSLPSSSDISLMGGGLINSRSEVDGLLLKGLAAVSVSNPQLW